MSTDAQSLSPAVADVRALRAQMRAWRRGRADTRLVDAISDAYIALFATVMLGSMAANVVVSARSAAAQACSSDACLAARGALPWVFALSVLTACLGLARLFGPMLVSPAVGSWLLSAPIDRGALLRPRLVGTGLVSFLGGAVLTAAGATLAGFDAGAVVAFAVSVGSLCLAAVGLACLAQAAGSPLARVATWVLAFLVWAGLVALTSDRVPAHGTEPGFGTGWLVAAAAALLLGAALVVRAGTVLHHMHRDRLTPGGSLVPGLSGALSSLDLALVYDILLSRHWLSRSTVRPVRGRGAGVTALLWRDAVRLRRNPASVLVLAACLVLPYLAGTLGLGRLVVLVAATTGFFAALGLFPALRVLSRTPSLARCLPFEPWVVKAASVVVPGGALLLWGLGTTPVMRGAMGLTWPVATLAGLAAGEAAFVAVARWMTGRPPDYQLPLVTSPMGAVPTSLYGSAARGFDVLLLLSAPLLFSPTAHGAEASIAIGAVVLAILLGRR